MSAGAAKRASVFGLLMVRNEVDLVRINVVHHLQTSCDRILIIDNGSSDGTTTAIKRLARRLPVDWTSNGGAYQQGEVVTGLAEDARKAGAEWVLPLDADEFWIGSADLREVLAAQPSDVGALRVERIDFIQSRDELRSRPQSVLSMTRRCPDTEPGAEMIERFRANQASIFELRQPSKLALRTTPELTIHKGAHDAAGLSGEIVPTRDAAIFHAQIRSREAIYNKIDAGRRVLATAAGPDESWHLRHWVALADAGRLDEAWDASSYGEDGALDVAGRKVPLVEDLRMREVLAPWVRSPLKQRLARFTGRSF